MYTHEDASPTPRARSRDNDRPLYVVLRHRSVCGHAQPPYGPQVLRARLLLQPSAWVREGSGPTKPVNHRQRRSLRHNSIIMPSVGTIGDGCVAAGGRIARRRMPPVANWPGLSATASIQRRSSACSPRSGGEEYRGDPHIRRRTSRRLRRSRGPIRPRHPHKNRRRRSDRRQSTGAEFTGCRRPSRRNALAATVRRQSEMPRIVFRKKTSSIAKYTEPPVAGQVLADFRPPGGLDGCDVEEAPSSPELGADRAAGVLPGHVVRRRHVDVLTAEDVLDRAWPARTAHRTRWSRHGRCRGRSRPGIALERHVPVRPKSAPASSPSMYVHVQNLKTAMSTESPTPLRMIRSNSASLPKGSPFRPM